MQIIVTGHHIDITDSMRDYVTSKMDKIERHFDHVGDLHVVLSVEKLRQKAEATLDMHGGKNLFAESEDEDMYAAIDALVDKLDRQVLKHKAKQQDRHREDLDKATAVDEA